VHRSLLKDLLTIHRCDTPRSSSQCLRFDPSEEVHAALDKLLAYEIAHSTVINWEDLENLNHIPGLEKCRVSIWQGDICSLKIGAIVNAANCFMLVRFLFSYWEVIKS
jgi:hypothetical protein